MLDDLRGFDQQKWCDLMGQTGSQMMKRKKTSFKKKLWSEKYDGNMVFFSLQFIRRI